ncbi:MAG: helix-turn-helix domain-containing protein [Anaerolineaceae bacterium]|nr:helix-turn-helix domain-containing protein [Anaerolineaceae bacterium]
MDNQNGEQTHFWQSQELGSAFESLTATYITHAFGRHTHEGFAIGVIERGAETFYYRGAMHTAPAGSVVVVSPDELHTGQAAVDNGWSYRMMYPAADLLARVASEIAGSPRGIPYFDVPIYHDSVVFDALRSAQITLEQSHSALERESCLIHALALLVRRHAVDRPILAQSGLAHDALRQAQDYLHANYAEDISLEGLAKLVYLSPFHLSRLFRDQLGLPPHTYLNQIRVNRAKTLLNTGLSLAGVAHAVGFADQSHLTKAFKRVVGIPPGQYRTI